MKIKHCCFDLDGTLVDSSDTIYKSTIATLEKLGITYNFTKNDLDERIGQHFADIFDEFGVIVNDFETFIKLYKSLYFNFIEDSVLYPDVLKSLEFLKKNSCMVSLLTTKAQDQADLIIDHFKLRPYFNFVMGRTNDIPHKPSPEPLLLICKKLGVLPSESMMIGDTELDIQCGKNAGARSCAVTYGYRTEEKLKAHKPDFIIDSLLQLERVFYNGKLL